MLVRLIRLAIGRVIGDLLARTIFPVTEDVREKKRTINQVEGNIVPVNDYQDTRDATKVYLNVPLHGHLYGTWNFFSQPGGTCHYNMIRKVIFPWVGLRALIRAKTLAA